MPRRPLCRSVAAWGFCCSLLLFVNGGKRNYGLATVSASWATHPTDESGFSTAPSWDLSSGDSSSGGRRRDHSGPSRSSRPRNDVRRKKRRKRKSTETTTSSSDNLWDEDFLPLVFSEDEREEEILSALAKVEEEDHAQRKQRKRPRKNHETTAKSQNKNSAAEAPTTVSSQTLKSTPPVAERKKDNGEAVEGTPVKKVAQKEKQEQPATIQPTQQSVPSMSQPLPNNSANDSTKVQNNNKWQSHTPSNNHHSVNSASNNGSQPRVASPTTSERTAGTAGVYPRSPATFVSSSTAGYSKPGENSQNTAASLNGFRYPPASHAAAYRPSATQTSPVRTQSTYTQPKSQSRQQQADPSATSATTPWVRRFLSSRPKDALLPIPRAYLSDGFNLVQLAPIVERVAMTTEGYRSEATTPHKQSSSFPYYKAALRLILQENEHAQAPVPAVQRAAEALYLLVHARYVISPRGLDTVRRVMRRETSEVDAVFGRCPRFGCRGMPLLPYGESDDIDLGASPTSRAKRYCCCCGEKLYMWDSKVDGCAWGPSFCHLFLMTYGEDVFPGLVRIHDAEKATPPDEKPVQKVAPTIFGFRLHPSCKVRYPRRVDTNR